MNWSLLDGREVDMKPAALMPVISLHKPPCKIVRVPSGEDDDLRGGNTVNVWLETGAESGYIIIPDLVPLRGTLGFLSGL